MSTIETIIKEGKATIIDVRSHGEFMGGHVPGSKNIPLQEIPDRLDEFKNMKNTNMEGKLRIQIILDNFCDQNAPKNDPFSKHQ